MKKLITGAIAIATLVLPSTANAAAYCVGTVSNVFVYGSGDVVINGSWRNGWTTICNVNEERLGIKPQTCFTWFSAVSSGITENKQVGVYYANLNSGDCATIPTYGSSPAPYYVRLVK